MPAPILLGLTLADQNSGTALVTVTGAAVGDYVDIFYAPWSPRGTPQTWIDGGTVTVPAGGIASLAPSPGFGYWIWQASSSPSSNASLINKLSPSIFLPLVNPAAKSIWEQCVTATATFLQSLTLPGISSNQILVKLFPSVNRTTSPTLPCVLVAPFGAEGIENQMNQTDDIGFPVMVVLFDAANKDTTGNMSRNLLWRERISRAFRYQRLPAVPSIVNCVFQPDVVFNPDAYNVGNLAVSAMIFRYMQRDKRGVY